MNRVVTSGKLRILAGSLLLLFFGLVSNLSAAEISASVGAGQVSLNESFQMTFIASGSVDKDPDFSPLEADFQILKRSQSTSLSIINGQLNSTRVWKLMLMAKRAGELTLPAIAFGKDKSNSLKLKVVKPDTSKQATADRDIYIDVEVDNASPYVQQEVMYTVRVFRAVNINTASLNNPSIEGGDALIEKLGEDRNNEIWKNNKRYQITERRFVIFPQSSGDMTIQPVQLEVQLQGNNSSVFDYYRFNSSSNNRIVRIESKPVQLKVKPVPAEFSGDVWLPAKSLHLDQEWSLNPAKLITGEPVTRSIRISVEGLGATQLPALPMSLPDGLKSYPDQPVFEQKPIGQGSMSSRLDKIAIIPSKPGSYQLPSISLAWWNTEKDRQEIAQLPAVELSVMASTGMAINNTSATPPDSNQAPINAADEPQAQQVAAVVATPEWLYALLVFMALGWIVTLLAWWWTRRQATAQRPRQKAHMAEAPSLSAIHKRMSLACVQHDAKTVRDCLLEWAALQWPDESIRHLSAIAARVDDDFRKDVLSLEKSLYSQVATGWNGQQFFERFKQQRPNKTTAQTHSAEGLEPLYRIV